MRVKIVVMCGAMAAGLLCAPADSIAEQLWSVDRGRATLMLNHQPLEELGVFVSEADTQASSGKLFSVIESRVLPHSGMTYEVVDRGITNLFGETLQINPGVRILAPTGEYVVTEVTVLYQNPSYGDAVERERQLKAGEVEQADAPTLLLTDIKRSFDWRSPKLKIFSRALKISGPLARALGNPELADVPLGSAMLTLETHWIDGEEPATPEAVSESAPAGEIGPDVSFCQLYDLLQYGRKGDIVGLSVATTSWNLGDEPVDWIGFPSNRHPFIIMNLYRLKDDRFEQIGQSWIKHAFCALDNTQCGGTCVPTGCNSLNVNCTDTYSSSLNASRGSLGPRYEVNPWTGAWNAATSHLAQGTHAHDEIEHRLQVHDADLDPLLNLGATYFVESFYCAYDDVNAMNSVAWKPVTPFRVEDPDDPDFFYEFWFFEMTDNLVFPNIGWAIDAWEGASQALLAQEIPVVEFESPDGRCVLATKVTELPGGGRWHYEYALLNVDMDRQVGSFSLPLPPGASLTNIGFHAVESHDEPFSNDPWTVNVTTDSITWSTEFNPLRWGTLYNFRFDADLPPGDGTVTLGLHKPGTPEVVTGTTQVPSLFGPYIVHGRAGDSFQTCGFSGYIDPRAESITGDVVNTGLTEVTLVFSEPVQSRGGAPLSTNSFLVRETGSGTPPTIDAVSTTDNQTVTLVFDRVITPQEWTTVQCKVQNMAGIPVENQGDLGPGVPEPDRIDFGFLPADVNQDGLVAPVDLIRFRQYIAGTDEPAAGILADYIDTNRDGMVSPSDLLDFRQLLAGTGEATKVWAGQSMNNPQP